MIIYIILRNPTLDIAVFDHAVVYDEAIGGCIRGYILFEF